MAPSKVQGSRSREARDDSASEPYSDELNVSSPSILDTAEGGNIEKSFSTSSSDGDGSEEEPSVKLGDKEGNGAIKQQLSTVSFGALAKAQKSLMNDNLGGSRKRKRDGGRSQEAEQKLKALRERLRELQKSKKDVTRGEKSNTRYQDPSVSKGNEVGQKQPFKSVLVDDMRGSSEGAQSDSESESMVSSANEDSKSKKSHRTSKHAPTEQSSKYAVSRKRTVVSVPKLTARDPRFDPLAGPLNQDAIKKKYAFLDNYQKSELTELKSALKTNKKLSDKEQENLKKKILSIESRQKAADANDKKKEVLREHRKKEKELVKMGKVPFYLKKSELKKQALVKTFEGMKGKEKDRAIERRRRKLAARDRRNMPDARRG